jgi:hypothetical protein
MLTPVTQIPTSIRGQVRAMVKAYPAWPAFLTEKGLISASAKNADLIELALRHPALKAQIEQVLDAYTAAAPKESAAVLMLANRVERLLVAYSIRRRTAKPRSLTSRELKRCAKAVPFFQHPPKSTMA